MKTRLFILAVALVYGTAYHIIEKHNDKNDGYLAWKSLCTWYDGDEVKTKAAENARSKLELLSLHSGVTASDYVNKFMNYFLYKFWSNFLYITQTFIIHFRINTSK